ncbi:MAG: penicillin-binding protein 1A [Thermodesulfobacteriota bacterium]
MNKEFFHNRRLRRFVLIPAGIFLFFLLFSYVYFVRSLPPIDAIKDYQPNLVSRLYAQDGQLIGEFYIERRVIVPFSKIPAHLINAFLAAEDSQFYKHEGISYIGIFRAFYKNISAGRIVQGGSTITQQVARSLFLTPEKKISRKVREMILARRIEKRLNKNEILSLYLNQIYLGKGAYGVQAAAQAYFGKDVEDLDIAESAILAGLPKAPSKYSPYANFERSKKRQEFIIKRMVEDGFITSDAADAAVVEEIKLKPVDVNKNLWVAPYFKEHIRRYIEEEYGDDILYRGGLNIFTTLDVKFQNAANAAVKKGLRNFDRRRGWRGPVQTLVTPEDIDAFREEMDKKLESHPIRAGGVYDGVVTSVDEETKKINVDIGSRAGVMTKRAYRWAIIYNPDNEIDGTRVEDPFKLFKPGDVIKVKVKSVSADETVPLPLKLTQEPLVEAALLAMEPETGYIKAMVGGSDFSKTQFNRTIQSYRQPGSAFKPIIYAAAFDRGFTPATVVMDTPIVFEDTENETSWRPRNYDEHFAGATTVRKAIAHSRNVISIKVLNKIGVPSALEYAEKLGITTPLARDLSLALGSSVVTLQDMTTAYATFANRGMRPKPLFITKIIDREGNVVEDNTPEPTEALSPETAYIMTKMLEGVIEHGTGWRARALGRPAAGKTGTTNNLNDAWFLGYVPGLAAGTWVGYDNERELGKHETGSRAALPIWLDFMKGATEGTPIKNFPVPDGIEFARIDEDTGLLASPFTEHAIFEVFKTGTVPTEVSVPKSTGDGADFFITDTNSGAPVPGLNDEEELQGLPEYEPDVTR